MNYYVGRYRVRRIEGFGRLEAFGIIASSIAISGTIEDLKELDKAFHEDLSKETEELINVRTTSAISS